MGRYGRPAPKIELATTPDYSAATAPLWDWISCQTTSGVAGMSISVTPRPCRASMMPLITAAGEATEPASPQPLTPISLFLQGTSTVETAMEGTLSARGMQ